jgi:hypothetical protein
LANLDSFGSVQSISEYLDGSALVPRPNRRLFLERPFHVGIERPARLFCASFRLFHGRMMPFRRSRVAGAISFTLAMIFAISEPVTGSMYRCPFFASAKKSASFIVS